MNNYKLLWGCLLIIIVSSAFSINLCTTSGIQMTAEKKELSATNLQWVEAAYQRAEAEKDAYKRAYSLSMLLIISAKSGDISSYQRINAAMSSALGQMTSEQNSRKAWLLGRRLAAAKAVNSPDVDAITATLKALLHNSKTTPDIYTAWAWGYLADVSPEEYHAAKTSMTQAAVDVTKKYDVLKEKKEEPPEKVAEELSSVLWAWVMNLQAAANAGDRENYQRILAEIENITQQKSITNALSNGIPIADYRAWALAIAYFAAVVIEDKERSDELRMALPNAIKLTRESGNIEGVKLAQLMINAADKIALQKRDEKTLGRGSVSVSQSAFFSMDTVPRKKENSSTLTAFELPELIIAKL